MAVGIGAVGYIGVAFETTYGTYVAPTEYIPIRSESLVYQQDTQWRRVIRQVPDIINPAVAGFSHVEGEIEIELLENAIPYFLHCSRVSVVKSGSNPNFTYTYTPAHLSTNTGMPKNGLSITVVRSGIVFGYLGCVVTGWEVSVDNGTPIIRFTIVGLDEAVQSSPTPAWQTGLGDQPYGAGQYDLEIPTASDVFDIEEFTFSVNDNGEPVYRLNNTTKARYVKFGEREVTCEVTRDFVDRTEYDAFKALTATSVNITCSKGANNSVNFKLPNAVRETYDLDGLSDQGSLIQATVNFNGLYDAATSKSYEVVVKTQEDIS